ncbi:RHS repeat domain-containing protein [Acanthopleuribacter pedis]|uniref:Uncharacterized protein n=1 Tax=Acanthopleuribacter pedis TaxID=442870 RepID=A0A8J7U769_9BACT|nr:RHS repeat-associated core domain-containing protein [Acanthopleuribacter pedis]MBO1322694.1 hypothetical protein [Acanthopleuribacter pedis]
MTTKLKYLTTISLFLSCIFASLTGFDEEHTPPAEQRNPAITEPQNGVSPLSSDSDNLGLNISAPYSSVNEFTGKLNIILDPIGVGGMSLRPVYKSYQQKVCNDESGFRLCPMNEPNLSSVLGEGWNFHLGYIIARNAIYGSPGSSDWERVRFVDTAGNVATFGRDGVFQADPNNGGASDTCVGGSCMPSQVDVHFIDDQLRRITRARLNDGTSLQGFSRQPYYLLDPNGRRTEYRATRLVTNANNASSVTFHPTAVRAPNGRAITISYVGGTDPDGTLPDMPRIERVTDSYGRSLVFDYEGNNLAGITLEAGNQSKLLKSFRYQQVSAGGSTHTVLHKVVTPEGYETVFTTSDIGQSKPVITAMTLPTGGTVEYDYDTELFLYLHADDANCRAVRDDDCVELELRGRSFTRISEIRHSGGRYQFTYRQWSINEERGNGSGEGRIDVTVKQLNGNHVFTRKTSYINAPIFETYFQTFANGYLVGRAREKETTYRGSTLRESWLYTRELNIGGHAGGDPVSVSAVRQYAQQIDGQWIDTNYEYSWCENGTWKPQDFKAAFLQPTRISRQARDSDVRLIRTFDYDHRFVENFGWDRDTTIHQYALALLTEDEQILSEGSGETLLTRTTYRYEDVFRPFPTKVERRQDSDNYLTESYSYYQTGVNLGLLHTAQPLGQKIPTEFTAYQFGQASVISLPENATISRTIAFDGTLSNETVDGVTTVYGYDNDFRVTRVDVPDTAPLKTEYTPPGSFPSKITTFYELSQAQRFPADQPFPIATRTQAERIPVEALTLDDWGRTTDEVRRTSPNTEYTRTYGFSPLGLKETIEAENGRWTYHFDVLGRPTRTEHHDTRDDLQLLATDFVYQTTGNGSTVITQTTQAQTRDYSALPIEPRLPGTRVSTKTQVSETDIAARLVQTETNGQAVHFTYSSHARGIEKTALPFNNASLARVTVTNLLGDLVLENHPEIEWPIHYEYNEYGLLREQYHGSVNDKKMRRVWRYDDAGRIIERLGATTQAPNVLVPTAFFDYDTRNRLTEAVQYSRHEHPVTITFDVFDGANRVKAYSVQIPRLEHTDFSVQPYSDQGEPHVYTVNYTYDALGRVSSTKHPNGGFAAFGYEFDFAPYDVFYGFGPNHASGPDFVKVVTSGRYHPYNGNNLTAVYDLDRCQAQDCAETLQAMRAPESAMRAAFGGQVFTSTHDYLDAFEAGARKTKKHPNVGTNAIHRVDSLGRPRLNRLWDPLAGGKSIHGEAFIQYNAFGFIDHFIGKGRLFSPRLFFFGYTDLGQLEKLTMGSDSIDYRYDQVGNLTYRSGLNVDVGSGRLTLDSFSAQYSNGNPFHVDALGKVYDRAGRLIEKPGYVLGYNAAGRFERLERTHMVQKPISDEANWQEYYLYDAFGRRVAALETVANKVTYSVRDLNGSILTEEDVSTYAKTRGVLTARRQYVIFDGKAVYVDEETFALNGDQRGRAETYRFHDRLGNPVVTWDAETEAIQSQYYEPFGTPMVNAMNTEGAHGFGGHDEDNTGLVYMKARFYQPTMGCFLQPDAGRDFNPYLPNSYNLYSYAYQNPANAYDPDGNAVETAWDAFNIGIGVASFVYNVKEGNWLDATIDAGGVVVDGIAAATPFVPGGAGSIIKAARAGDKIVDGAKAADKANDAKKAADAADTAADAAGAAKKRDTLQPGPHSKGSVPARSPDKKFTRAERDKINVFGRKDGCHTCGTKDPGTKSGDFIPDHQPPSKMNKNNEPQVLMPHCKKCSQRQGGQVRQATKEN